MALSGARPGSPPARFPLLDPMRALAAIAVMMVHTSIFSGALDRPVAGRLLAHLDIGVPFFFLLSAFLLYRPFLQARVTGTARTSFTDYGRRRFIRVMPAYWVALTIAAIVAGVAGAFSGNWWVYYGLLMNFPVYEATGTCAVDPYRCGISIAWSLSMEVFFYLTLPLYVLAMGWVARRWRGRWLTLELTAVALLSAVSLLIQRSVPQSDLHTWLFFSPLGRGWWFGLGLGLAAISIHSRQRPDEPPFIAWLRRHPGPPVVAGGLLYVVSALTIFDAQPTLAFPVGDIGDYVIQYVLVGVIAALFLLPGIFGDDGGGLVRSLLRHRWLGWLGLVSYGIFLWHFPVLIVLIDAGVDGFVPLTLLTFAGTVGCAALSYYLLERPLMDRVRRRQSTAPTVPR